MLTLCLLVMAFRSNHPLERVGFALITGGSSGNIIDRLRHGAVTDFLDLYWKGWHWPTFNLADIAIFMGAMCILATALPPRLRKDQSVDQG